MDIIFFIVIVGDFDMIICIMFNLELLVVGLFIGNIYIYSWMSFNIGEVLSIDLIVMVMELGLYILEVINM